MTEPSWQEEKARLMDEQKFELEADNLIADVAIALLDGIIENIEEDDSSIWLRFQANVRAKFPLLKSKDKTPVLMFLKDYVEYIRGVLGEEETDQPDQQEETPADRR